MTLSGYNPLAAIHIHATTIDKPRGLIGLFLVPVGDLENWVPGLMGDVGKSDKSRWADIASERIRLSPTETGDVWEFMKEVVSYLDEQRRR
jgi:hypothetical protein